MAVMIENIEEQPIKRKRAQQKNRARGERVTNAKLREKDVVAIRLLYANHILSGPKLAKNYHVCTSTIFKVVRNQTWRHVETINGGRNGKAQSNGRG